jgi:hypothetical protein
MVPAAAIFLGKDAPRATRTPKKQRLQRDVCPAQKDEVLVLEESD